MPSARGCCISFRSRRMSRRASPCWMARRSRSFSTGWCWRCLPKALPRPTVRSALRCHARSPYAADQTFKDVIREAIGDRQAVRAWLDAAGSVDAAVAQLSATLGVGLDETVEAIDAASSISRRFPQGNGRPSRRRLPKGSKTDEDQSDRFASLASAAGDRADRRLRLDLLQRKARPQTARASDHQSRSAKVTQRCSNSFVDEQARVCALLERRRAAVSRDRTAALITITDAVLRRYQTEKDRRGLLDYADLIDKTLALFESVDRGLGALQARSRHRPHADRRGAGHQSAAMEDRRDAWLASSPPARARAVSSSARCLPSVTTSSRSFHSRAPRR